MRFLKYFSSDLKISRQEAVQSLHWTSRLRWLLVTLFLITFILVRQLISTKILYIIIACCGVEYLHNLFLIFLNKKKLKATKYFLYVSPLVDMIIIVVGVYFSGKLTFGSGVIYIIPFVYSIPIITISVILSISAGLFVATIASVLFGLLAFYGFSQGVIPGTAIFLIIEKIAYFFIITFLSGYLAYIAKQKAKELETSYQNLELKNKKLIKTQEQLIQSEKLASITQIAVSLNHEINNPLTSVLADIQFALLKLRNRAQVPNATERAISCLQAAEQEALRIKSIMENLRNLTQPVVEDYIPGIKMINIEKSMGDKKPPPAKA
jgi:signal transduction histidine kinase